MFTLIVKSDNGAATYTDYADEYNALRSYESCVNTFYAARWIVRMVEAIENSVGVRITFRATHSDGVYVTVSLVQY